MEPALVRKILELNSLDALLYNATLAAFEAALLAAKGEPGSAERGDWDADALEFRRMQAALAASLEGAAEAADGACRELRGWYTLRDTQYEALVDARGFAAVPPAATAEAMRAAYARSGGTRFC